MIASPISANPTAWEEAKTKGWTVVSMKDNSKTIFPKRNHNELAQPAQ
jgi:hypothetical protein